MKKLIFPTLILAILAASCSLPDTTSQVPAQPLSTPTRTPMGVCMPNCGEYAITYCPPGRDCPPDCYQCATHTPQVMCTPPACGEDEAFHCQDECPGECGTVCATHTPPSEVQIQCTPPPCTVDESYYCPGECPGGCGTICATNTPGPSSPYWSPEPGSTFHIQFEGDLDLSLDVDIYIVDLIDTPREDIQTLKARGMAVICYFSAGSYEDWRPDADSFPQKVIGEPLDNWPGESWLDISELEALGPIMTARFQIALAKGCDGVDLDNVDGYSNQTGFPLTYEDQITYNRWLADQAHKRGLAVGLKNDLPQYSDLIAEFDFAVNEECFSYQECGPLADFVEAGKAVFVIEYGNDTGEYCSIANSSQFMMVRKNIELDAWSDPCWGD